MRPRVLDRSSLRPLLLAGLVLTAFTPALSAREPAHKPHFLLIGTYHMANPNRDVFNAKSDDVRGDKRQKEIAELMRMLARYRPTKVVIEAPYESPTIDEQYQQYLAGSFELPPNESYQLGFRLAKEMGHKRIYTVDWQKELDFDAVMAAANKYDQKATVDGAFAYGKSFVDQLNKRIETDTIAGILGWMNGDEMVDGAEQIYLRMARIGKGDDYSGADLVAAWHERNLKIFANILRITDSPDDRVIVFYGSGHAKLLTEFAEDSREYTVERPSAYLK